MVSRSSHTGCVAGTVPWPPHSLGVLICESGQRGRRRRKGGRVRHTRCPCRPGLQHISVPLLQSVHSARVGDSRTLCASESSGTLLKTQTLPCSWLRPRRPTRNLQARGPGPTFSNKHTKQQVWRPLDKTPSKGLSHQTSRGPMSLAPALASVKRDLPEVTSAGTLLLQVQAEPLQIMWGPSSPSP